jgi:hypothetical protein
MSRRVLLDAPRAPTAPRAAQLYESHYLTAADPAGGRAVWLRYTALKEDGADPRGTLWCTYFAADRAPRARRTGTPEILTSPGAHRWAQVGDAWIGPGAANGNLEDCSWAMTWLGGATPLAYLPSERLYDRRLPRSNGAAIVPDATFAGSLKIAGTSVDVAGWRGVVGHNWGADHADRWIWLHVPGLGPRDPGGWLDLILARVRLAGRLSPWLPAGALALDGALRRVRATETVRGLRVAVEPERVAIALPRWSRAGLAVEVDLPAQRTVQWDYSSPAGGGRHVRNCSVAAARLRVGSGAPIDLHGTAAVEIGG